MRYSIYANERKLNEVSSFSYRATSDDIKLLWDYKANTHPILKRESDVQVGWKSSDKLKVLGFGGDLKYELAAHLLYLNINSAAYF